MSQCGTFAVIGSTGGSICMFNMQSGQYRQSYPSQKAKIRFRTDFDSTKQQENIPPMHTKAVTGLAIDGLNRTVVSCGLDGKVKVGSSNSELWLAVANYVYGPL